VLILGHLPRNNGCSCLSSKHRPIQLIYRLVARKCISILDIWGWSCNSLSPVSLPSIPSKASTNNCSPLCDTRIRVVQQEPLHFYRVNCSDDRERRCWHCTDSPPALSVSRLTIRETGRNIYRIRGSPPFCTPPCVSWVQL
jgi:hypothetical protein